MIKKTYNRCLAPGSSNKGLMVVYHKTEPPHLPCVEMATIVTYIQGKSGTIHTTGLNFDLQPDVLDLPGLQTEDRET